MKLLDKLISDAYSLPDLRLKVVKLKPQYLVAGKNWRSLPLVVLSQSLYGSLVDVLEEGVTLLCIRALPGYQQLHHKVREHFNIFS